jgi:hypothetical protein
MVRHCAACGGRFRPDRRVPTQCYCGAKDCRRVRRARWERRKRLIDKDYRSNQAAAGQQWSKKHPEYWREYRRTHPEYRERERLLRRQRRARAAGAGDRHTAEVTDGHTSAAKMDSIGAQVPVVHGVYCLTRVCGGRAAKMDSMFVQLTVMHSDTMPQERTRTCVATG